MNVIQRVGLKAKTPLLMTPDINSEISIYDILNTKFHDSGELFGIDLHVKAEYIDVKLADQLKAWKT